MQILAQIEHISYELPMTQIPTYALYGEDDFLPDFLHCERIRDRAGPNGWTITPHRHPHLHQLFRIESPGATLKMDGQDHLLPATAVVNVPAGTVHGFRFAPNTHGQVITLAQAELPEVFGPASDVQSALSQAGFFESSPQLDALFAGLQQEYEARQPGRHLYLRGMLVQILCVSARLWPGDATPPKKTRAAQIMADFEDLVLHRFRNRPTVSDCARTLGLSPTHLSRVVREVTGAGAQSYLDRVTLREACRQLAYSSLDIQQIGFDLGFEDPTYFSRLFRKRLGLSPKAYRNHVRQKAPGHAGQLELDGVGSGAQQGEPNGPHRL